MEEPAESIQSGQSHNSGDEGGIDVYFGPWRPVDDNLKASRGLLFLGHVVNREKFAILRENRCGRHVVVHVTEPSSARLR